MNQIQGQHWFARDPWPAILAAFLTAVLTSAATYFLVTKPTDDSAKSLATMARNETRLYDSANTAREDVIQELQTLAGSKAQHRQVRRSIAQAANDVHAGDVFFEAVTPNYLKALTYYNQAKSVLYSPIELAFKRGVCAKCVPLAILVRR